MTTTPRQLSRQLRHSRHPDVRRRRAIVALSLTAAASIGVVSLYQTGIIGHVPEPPMPGFDADKVDASDEAYSYVSTPDSLLGLTSYAATAVLAAMGGEDRARTRPWIPVAMAGKVLADSAVAAGLTWDQWAKHKAFCIYCLIASACTFGMLPLMVPEVRHALASLAAPSRLASKLQDRSRPLQRPRGLRRLFASSGACCG